jgi:hypothetical protein
MFAATKAVYLRQQLRCRYYELFPFKTVSFQISIYFLPYYENKRRPALVVLFHPASKQPHHRDAAYNPFTTIPVL